MSALRLAVLVVLGAVCCIAHRRGRVPGANQELFGLTRAVEQLKVDMQTRLREAIDEMKHAVSKECGQAVAPDTQPGAPPPLYISGSTETDITRKLQVIEQEVSEVKRKLDLLSDQQGSCCLESAQQWDVVPSRELKKLQDAIGKQLTETLNVFEHQLENLPSKAHVEAVVKGQTEDVKDAVKAVQETCGNDEKLDGLVETVREVKQRVEETNEAAQDTRSMVEFGQQQDVSEELRGVGEKVQEVVLRVGGLKDDLKAQIQHIGGRVEELTNTTQANVYPGVEAELAPSETGPTYPCLDSTFAGSANATCQLAVRFSRCSLPKVSYHCCRTCTDAGQLPETGPWRHQDLQRTVTTLETIRFFVP